mgnify:CR=1 FL=1
MFQLHAVDDKTVPVENTLAMFSALKAAGVPVEMHVFEEGGHGFGLRFTTGKPVAAWPGLFEAFATSFSPMLYISLAICAIDWVFYPAILAEDWGGLALAFVLVSLAIALIQTSSVIALKWLLMGRYRPGMRPMWSWWAMRTEAIAVAYWGLAGKVLLVLTDRHIAPGKLPAHAALATGAAYVPRAPAQQPATGPCPRCAREVRWTLAGTPYAHSRATPGEEGGQTTREMCT